MYSFFCCCFGADTGAEAEVEASLPPSLATTTAVNLTSNVVADQNIQTRPIRTDDIVVIPPGLIDEISDDEKEESKSKQVEDRVYVSAEVVSISSPALFKRTAHVSAKQVDKLYDFLLGQASHTVTILLQLQIQNNIITPLKQGKYDLASNNFCQLFQVRHEVFDACCKVFDIHAEEDELMKHSYQQAML